LEFFKNLTVLKEFKAETVRADTVNASNLYTKDEIDAKLDKVLRYRSVEPNVVAGPPGRDGRQGEPGLLPKPADVCPDGGDAFAINWTKEGAFIDPTSGCKCVRFSFTDSVSLETDRSCLVSGDIQFEPGDSGAWYYVVLCFKTFKKISDSGTAAEEDNNVYEINLISKQDNVVLWSVYGSGNPEFDDVPPAGCGSGLTTRKYAFLVYIPPFTGTLGRCGSRFCFKVCLYPSVVDITDSTSASVSFGPFSMESEPDFDLVNLPYACESYVRLCKLA